MLYGRLKVFLGVVLFMLMTQSLLAQSKEISERFLQKANDVVDIVKSKTLSADERNDQIIKVIEPLFDFRLMAKLSLGKERWRTLSEEKKKEFTTLYVKRMKDSYSKKIDNYTDEKIVVRRSVQDKKNRVTLVTDLVGADDNTEVVYKYYHPKKRAANKDEWLIYDAVISGVSIIKTDKSQFKEVLREQSIDVLMDKMRNNKK